MVYKLVKFWHLKRQLFNTTTYLSSLKCIKQTCINGWWILNQTRSVKFSPSHVNLRKLRCLWSKYNQISLQKLNWRAEKLILILCTEVCIFFLWLFTSVNYFNILKFKLMLFLYRIKKAQRELSRITFPDECW